MIKISYLKNFKTLTWKFFFFFGEKEPNMEVRNRLMIKILKMLLYKSYILMCQIIKNNNIQIYLLYYLSDGKFCVIKLIIVLVFFQKN